MNKNSKRIIGVLVILVFWVFFLFQEEMAFYGIYSLINYNVHEASTIIPYLCLAVIFIWIVDTIIRIIKRKSDKKDKYFAVVLVVLLILNIGYFYNQIQYATTTTVATVECVDLENNTITIKNHIDENNENMIVLDSPELVINMVEIKSQIYTVTYQHKIDNFNEGKLSMIKLLQE